jgi:protein-S-isoprenylcysteine O-methyltransferase Ste14
LWLLNGSMKRLLPPVLVAGLFVGSLAVGLTVPLLGPLATGFRLLGVIPLVVGTTLNLTAAGLFGRAGTNIKTFDEPGTLVAVGPFRFSRNPMYLGFLLVLTGLALLVGSLSAWIGPVVFWLAAQFWYIPFEERTMQAKFGRNYVRYCRHVHRWLGRPGGRSALL